MPGPDENTPPDGDTSAPAKIEPKYLTAEDFNRALTARDKRFEAKFSEMLGKFQPPAPPDPPPDKAADPETVRLRREFETLTQKFSKSEEARLQAETQARTERGLATLQSSLSGKFNPKQLPILLKAFKSEMEWDADIGDFVIPVETKSGTQRLPIASAIEEWSQTEHAAFYLPAPSGGGSGSPKTSPSRGVGSSYQSKPRDQWTQAETEAFFQERLKAIAGE